MSPMGARGCPTGARSKIEQAPAKMVSDKAKRLRVPDGARYLLVPLTHAHTHSHTGNAKYRAPRAPAGTRHRRSELTTRPKLFPRHQHRWIEKLDMNRSSAPDQTSTLVRCEVCGWELPRPIAKYDDPTGSLHEDEPDVIPVHDVGVAT
jgi:hypothetical protein